MARCQREGIEMEKRDPLLRPGNFFCPGCPAGVIWKLILEVLGPNCIASIGSTCIGMPAVLYPSPLDIATIHVGMPGPAAVISGISAALEILREKGKITSDKKVTVIGLAGDGGTADIGFAALSGLAERNDDGIYFCFDNEAYMNTGIQRSSLTPARSWTTTTLSGKSEGKKDLPMIMAAHRIPYVATVSIGFPNDFLAKVRKARDLGKGFKYVHILAPCPVGWGFPTEKTVEISRLAVETGIWPLYEVEAGILRVTWESEVRRPVRDYFRMQKRFSHMTEEAIKTIESMVEQNPRLSFCQQEG
jgi:pyruvate ferredoxin oxidoreductase beta subunit